MTPEFEKRLEAEIGIFIQEMHDGCVDCLALRPDSSVDDDFLLCPKHQVAAMECIVDPRRYLKLGKA